jgi:hypothetical protein
MSERPDRFEEELREALRSEDGTPPSGAERDSAELLRQIHRGVARRRVRRRIGALTATAVLAGAFLVVAPLIGPTPPADETATGPAGSAGPTESQRSPRPTERSERLRPMKLESGVTIGIPDRVDLPPRAGDTVAVADVQVTSVSGSSAEEFWVSGTGTCGGGVCNVLGHSHGDEDVQFTALPGGTRHTETDVRFSGDGQTGFATNGVATFRTDDGGTKWDRLRQPTDVTVLELEAWGDELWAVGRRNAETVVLTDSSGTGRLEEVHSSVSFVPDQAVALGERAFGLPLAAAEPEFVHTGDGGLNWNNSVIGCKPADLSATLDAVWALCGGPTPALVKSLDQGATWERPEPLGADIDESTAMVAAIDTDTAFVTSGNDGWVVDATVPVPAGGLGDGPYVYAGFTTEDVGYVIDVDGNLCRSVNGGRSWERVETS